MDIDKLTVGDIRKIQSIFPTQAKTEQPKEHPYQVGKNYFIRTVTMIDIGLLVAVTDQELVLEDAVWCADTGRFTQALAEGNLSEVELWPSGELIIGRGAIVEACVWVHDLPIAQK